MNKIIRIIRMKTPDEVRKEMKRVLDHLEKDNVATTSNFTVIRMFPRFIPEVYKRDNTVLCREGIISIKPTYFVERCGDYSFRLKLREK